MYTFGYGVNLILWDFKSSYAYLSSNYGVNLPNKQLSQPFIEFEPVIPNSAAQVPSPFVNVAPLAVGS